MIDQNYCIKTEDGRIYRVISIDENTIYWIDIIHKTSWIETISLEYVKNSLASGTIKIVEEPYQRLLLNDEAFQDWQLEHRDRKWLAISPIIYKDDGSLRSELFNKKEILELIKAQSAQVNLHPVTIRSLIRLFLKRGLSPNSLIPDVNNKRGGPGKIKQRGRIPGRLSRSDRRHKNKTGGIAITDNIIARMQRQYKKHYVDKPSASLRGAYRQCILEEFTEQEIVDGNLVVRTTSSDKQPTFWQFKYWCHERRDPKSNSREAKRKRRRIRNDGQDVRNMTDMGKGGPACVAIADWTKGHRLLSSYNPAIDLGRCWILFIICVNTRMILGFHVGFKGENWMSIMLGFESMMMDKVKLCAKYGKQISKEEWPVECIIDLLLFDGGRFDSYDTEGLRNMNVATNAGVPAYPWTRAIIESINNKMKSMLSEYLGPTHSEKFDEENAVAYVDKNTYIYCLIECVLEHCRSVMRDYPLSKDLRNHSIPRVPIELWKYGLENLRQPRTLPLSVVRFNLLPLGKARVYPTHVEFKGLKFEVRGTREEKDAVYGLALLRKRKKHYDVQVKYNPALVDHIYAYEKGNLVNVFDISGNDRDFAGCSWDEVYLQQDRDREVDDTYTERADLHGQAIETTARINHDVAKSIEAAKTARKESRKAPSTAEQAQLRDAEERDANKAAAWTSTDVGAPDTAEESASAAPSEDKTILTSQITASSTISSLKPQTDTEVSTDKLPPRLAQVIKGNKGRKK